MTMHGKRPTRLTPPHTQIFFRWSDTNDKQRDNQKQPRKALNLSWLMPVKPNAPVPHLHRCQLQHPVEIELLVSFGLGNAVSLDLGKVLQDSTELSLTTTFVKAKLSN